MHSSILEIAILKSELSQEIKQFAEMHHIQTLDQLLQIKGSELVNMKGFSYRMLQSLLDYLNDQNALHLFKEQ